MADEIFDTEDILTLTDEDGVEMHFTLLDRCELDGNEYLALMPLEDNEAEECIILKIDTDENGEELLVTIDEDEEYDRVADYFEDELFDEIDYDGPQNEGK